MQRYNTWTDLTAADRGASVALGNFDGVHLGHRSVIALTQSASSAPLGIVTFEPHPRQFFAPHAPAFRLMNAEARAHRMEKIGVARLYELPFTAALAGMSAEGFARTVLAAGLGVTHVVVGADFRFGKGRTGTATDLQAFGRSLGFGVTVADLVAVTGADLVAVTGAGRVSVNGAGQVANVGTEISSTSIRSALSQGRPRDAARMLGHWHRIEGAVLHGEKRGRALGFPTANMSLAGLHLPRFGIYASKVDVLSGPHAGSYDGAASLGVRPMFGANQPNLETYLFDFDGDLYGEHLSVALVDYLRPELKFDSLPALITQMQADCQHARTRLAAL